MPDQEIATEESIDYSFLLRPATIGVTFIRFLAAVYILIDPLGGFIWSIIWDTLDGPILINLSGISHEQYHQWDKSVDWLAYATELWIGAEYGAFLPLFLLLFYRFMGQFMFLHYHRRIFFIIFPNFYEFVFLWVILFHPVHGTLTWPPEPLNWLLILLGAKMAQEIFLHFIKETPAFKRIDQYRVNILTRFGLYA